MQKNVPFYSKQMKKKVVLFCCCQCWLIDVYSKQYTWKETLAQTIGACSCPFFFCFSGQRPKLRKKFFNKQHHHQSPYRLTDKIFWWHTQHTCSNCGHSSSAFLDCSFFMQSLRKKGFLLLCLVRFGNRGLNP